MTIIDTKIISLIIHEEAKKKKIEKSREYGENAVLYDIPPMEPYHTNEEEDESETKRGVVVIDI